jgi:hypothetical protein
MVSAFAWLGMALITTAASLIIFFAMIILGKMTLDIFLKARGDR